MAGECQINSDILWEEDDNRGIIPRAVNHLFSCRSNQQISFCVTCVEIYNEEIFDLLAAETDNRKLNVYEDVNSKVTHVFTLII